jgi:hypothetical protein
MDCDRCVFKNKNFSNDCSLLTDKDVGWDCTTTVEEHKENLREAYRYFKDKKMYYNNLYKTEGGSKNYTYMTGYNKAIRETQEELNAL